MKLNKTQKIAVGGMAAAGIGALGIWLAKKYGLFSFTVIHKPPISREVIPHLPASKMINVYSPITEKYISGL